MGTPELSRREILEGAVAIGALTGTGTAAAQESQRTNRYNVGTATPEDEQAARRRADRVIRVLDWGNQEKTVTGIFTKEAIRGLRNRQDIRYIEEDGQWHAIAEDLPWGIDRVDAEVAHSNGETGSGAHIAVIDTGIDDDHPDLGANIGSGKTYVDCRGSNCNYPWSDDHDHGTHCSGIADAVDNSQGVIGVSTQATLHAVKVLDHRGSGYWSDIAAGIRYTADQGWDVGSMSLGGSSGSSTVKDACQYADNNGVLLVAAAGNEGPCSDCVLYPAKYSECLAVSATSNDDSLAGFSSTGLEVELAAPGDNIQSTVIGGYASYDGTSMACPHVAGTAGQLMANGYSNSDARSQMKSTAQDIGLSSKEQGSGLVDTAAALGFDSSDDLGDGESAVAVSTGDATNVGTDSATLNGTLDDLGGASSADCYFEYRESGTSTWATTSAQTLSSTGSFSQEVTGLASGTDYEYRAIAEASDGDSDTGTTKTFMISSSSGGTAPTATIKDVAETEDPSPHANFDVTWSAHDDDGDLATVTLTLTDDTTNSTEETASINVSGTDASGTTTMKAKHDDGTAHGYTVSMTVSDADSSTADGTDSATITENGS